MRPGAVARRITRTVLALLLVGVAAPGGAYGSAAEPDVTGSRDPAGVERYPRSWLVSYARDETAEPRELVMSRVDRIRRDLKVDERLSVQAELETAIYRTPDGTAVADVVDHYRQALGGDLLFKCEGRGCGRSADWANQIFGESILYGPDANQRYLVMEWQDRLASLYVIERGNKRVYAHLRVYEPEGEVGLEPDALLGRRLAERGWAVVESVRPEPDGTFTGPSRTVLEGLGARLAGIDQATVYVICHLYGRGETSRLLTDSQTCAKTAAELLGAGVEGGAGAPAFEAFGAGPLLPRAVPAQPRVELVLPGVVAAARP